MVKRVLVTGLSQDTVGGIESFLINMNAFMNSECVFDYAVDGRYTIYQDEINKKGGKCIFLPPQNNLIKHIKFWKFLLKSNKDRYETIYFNMHSLAFSVPIFIALSYGYRVAVHAHNNKLHNCGIVRRILHSINKHILHRKKIIRLTNSDLSAHFFFGRKQAQLIHCAINVDRFSFNNERRNSIRNRFLIKKENHLYGFSGRLTYQKNPLFLVEIFHSISLIDPYAKFIVCGEGELKKEMEEVAKRLLIDIIFTNAVKNIEDYYSAMDCFVFRVVLC